MSSRAAAEAAVEVLEADWAAPSVVRAFSSTRAGGVSAAPYASLNLAGHVGDRTEAVAINRGRLASALALPAEPLWLTQVHGAGVVVHASLRPEPLAPPAADGAVAFGAGRVLAVLTADCLPVVFARRDGRAVGIAHAGWRGLAAGILEAVCASLEAPAQRLLAWLGPAIGPAAFEVGEEVRRAFVEVDSGAAAAFTANACGRWQADLYALARRRLERLGIGAVSGGGFCTHQDPERFYSYRRDGATGRMATVVWIAERA